MTKPDSVVFFGYTCSKWLGDYLLNLGNSHWGVHIYIFTGIGSTESYSCSLSFYKYAPVLRGCMEGFEWKIRTNNYPTLKEVESKVLEIFETMRMPAEYWKNLEQLGSVHGN
jgi:hypothetical protein